MEIAFKHRKLAKIFNDNELLIQEFGKENGRIIMRRMSVLRAASNLAQVSHRKPEKRHKLKGKRKNQFAVNLKHPYRLIFEPNNDPIPLKEEGGIDLKKVTAIKIIGVEDYH